MGFYKTAQNYHLKGAIMKKTLLVCVLMFAIFSSQAIAAQGNEQEPQEQKEKESETVEIVYPPTLGEIHAEIAW